MVLVLLHGGTIWWNFFENALSDPFENLKYAPKNSGTRTSYGIKMI
jgi:hypothetical protein